MAANRNGVFGTLGEEVHQGHRTRRSLYDDIEAQLGGNARLVAYFTSFTHPVTIANDDGDMLEEVLRNSDLDGKHLYLLLSSPGGDGIAAERIVKICRTYSQGGTFSVIVPKLAKSAATMICLGAQRIFMSETSELGPIDPQFPIFDDRGAFIGFQAAHEIIKSYEDLLAKAVSTKGNVEPYIQLLSRYDAREIRRMLQAQLLSESIGVNLLKNGAMRGRGTAVIRKCIKPFIDPTYTKDHGRPIYVEAAERCGLDIELCDIRGDLWSAVWSLYVRLNHFVDRHASKALESAGVSCSVGIPRVT